MICHSAIMSARLCFIKAYARAYVMFLQFIAEAHCPPCCNHIKDGGFVNRAGAESLFKTEPAKHLFHQEVVDFLDHDWVNIYFREELEQHSIRDSQGSAFLKACDPYSAVHEEWSNIFEEEIAKLLYKGWTFCRFC